MSTKLKECMDRSSLVVYGLLNILKNIMPGNADIALVIKTEDDCLTVSNLDKKETNDLLAEVSSVLNEEIEKDAKIEKEVESLDETIKEMINAVDSILNSKQGCGKASS